jgi:AAA15 family ATPase/GTPase
MTLICDFFTIITYFYFMFINFEFGNFRSFRDLQKFSLEAAPIRPNDNGLMESNVFFSGNLRLLKTKAILGGNASGKSNLAKAISAFQIMVSRSVAQEKLPKAIWDDRFQLISDWDEQPMFFQYYFIYEKTIYRYGFQILDGVISYEWLYSGSDNKEKEYFMRGPDGLTINHAEFPLGDSFIHQQGEEENELFRNDALFLTAAALNGNRFLSKLRIEMRNIMTVDGVNDASAVRYAMNNFINGPVEKKQALIELLSAADTGIEDLTIDDLPEHLIDNQIQKELNEKKDTKAVSLFSYHPFYDWEGKRLKNKAVPFGEWESEGTGKFFAIGALVLDTLGTGRVIVIDEFDARLHPNLSLKIVELFQNEKTNPNGAQLIFVTHDTSLLRRANLRRDQICLVNKDIYGISSAVNIVQFKGVRKDASYEKEYLNGTYTGIPYLDKINRSVITSNKHYGLQKAE